MFVSVKDVNIYTVYIQLQKVYLRLLIFLKSGVIKPNTIFCQKC